MAKRDLQIIGTSAGNREYRVAASATRAEVGEPIHIIPSHTAGVSTLNTVILAAADSPVIGTHAFVGVNAERFAVNAAGTVIAQKVMVTVPIPQASLIRGKAQTKASIDTDAELLGVLWDVTVIDYNATGASDGGELYTIIETATANTGGLTIQNGNTVKGTLDCVIDERAMRFTIS